MSKFIKNVIALVLLSVSTAVLAQSNIAVVDVEDAILRCDYAQERIEELKKEGTYKDLFSEYGIIQSDLEAMQADQLANSSKWDIKQRQDFQERLVYLREDYESAAKKLNAKQKQVYQEIVGALQEKARLGLEEIIKEEKIGLLLDAKAALLKTPEYDITDKLVRKLNRIKQ